MIINQGENELAELVLDRSQAVIEYLGSQWQISSDRIDWQTGAESQPRAVIQLTLKSTR